MLVSRGGENMAINQFFAVTIEFAEAAPYRGNAHSDRVLVTRHIRLVESHAETSPSFILYDGDAPEYILSVSETEQLHQLLGQIEVKAPWQGSAGFDGTDYELTLLGAMSSVTFRWWVKVPAEWQQVGVLFDYVLALADRPQSAGS
jgi:hypothetical protein